MRGRADVVAVALVIGASAMAATGLALEVLGRGSTTAAIAFSAAGMAAGGACLYAWAHGPRRSRQRVPLLLVGIVMPAFAALALAPVAGGGPWGVVLTGAGIGGVGIAVVAVSRRQT